MVVSQGAGVVSVPTAPPPPPVTTTGGGGSGSGSTSTGQDPTRGRGQVDVGTNTIPGYQGTGGEVVTTTTTTTTTTTGGDGGTGGGDLPYEAPLQRDAVGTPTTAWRDLMSFFAGEWAGGGTYLTNVGKSLQGVFS